jgi:putative membrane protein
VVRNFGDHAANERTFLAWVRTAIAIMAFGFLVEKFDLFLQVARASIALHATPPPKSSVGEAAGVGLMVFGLAIVAVAAARFLKTAKEIDDPDQHLGSGSRFDLALAVLLLLLGGALLAYLVYTLLKVH